MDIAAFREQYPQYDAIDDATLANKLYEKHYAGKIERSAFDAKFFGAAAPVEKPSGNALDQAGQSGAAIGAAAIDAGATAVTSGGNWLDRAGDKVAGMFKGDAALDLPSIHDSGLKRGLGVGVSGAFGSDEEYIRAILKANPGHTEGRDANGNAMIVGPDGKPVTYPNAPGLDVDDAGRFFAKAAAFVPAGRIASAAGTAASSLGRFGQRLAAGAITNAGTDVAMQSGVKAAGGKGEVDAGQAVTAGLIGGAGEAVISPVVGRLVKGLKGRKPTDAQAARVARAALRDMGGAGNMTPDQLAVMGRRMIESGGEVTTEAARAEAFGMKLTRGQMMPDATEAQRTAKFRQLSVEEELRSMGDKGGQRLRDIDARNTQAIDDRIGDIQKGITDGNPSENALEAAERVKGGARDAERTLAGEVDDAYAEVDALDASLTGDSITGLYDRIKSGLDSGDIIVDELTPAGRNALKTLKQFSESQAAEEGASASTRFNLVERQRKIINRRFGSVRPGDKTDKALLTKIKNAFDRELDSAFRRGLYEGDEGILDAVKNARAVRTDYGSKFQNETSSGKVIQGVIDASTQPEKVIRSMIGKTGLSEDAANVAKRYADVVGRDSPAWGSFREMLLLTMVRSGTTTGTKGRDGLVSAFARADKGFGSSVVKEAFDENERIVLRQLGRAIESTLGGKEMKNPSGSARMLLRALDHGRLSNVPKLSEMIHNIVQKQQTSRAISAPKARVAPVSITGGAQASQAQTRNR